MNIDWNEEKENERLINDIAKNSEEIRKVVIIYERRKFLMALKKIAKGLDEFPKLTTKQAFNIMIEVLTEKWKIKENKE